MRISFKGILSVLVFCFSCQFALSQKRLLESLDTLLISPNLYLENYNSDEFFASGLVDEKIYPKDVDTDLLAAAIYYEINAFRVKRRREAYHQHSVLTKLAYSYINYHKAYKFRTKPSNQYRLVRFYRKAPKYVQLDFTYIEGLIALRPMVDYTKGDVYFNEEFESSPINLYLGKYSKEEDFEETPIQLITYREFAKRYVSELTRGKSGALLRSKAYELLSVELRKEEKRNAKSHIPQVKVICLLGAYRNKYILEYQEKDN